jgi:hypothetical protein
VGDGVQAESAVAPFHAPSECCSTDWLTEWTKYDEYFGEGYTNVQEVQSGRTDDLAELDAAHRHPGRFGTFGGRGRAG